MSTFGFNSTLHIELEYTFNKIFLNVSKPFGTNYLLANYHIGCCFWGLAPNFGRWWGPMNDTLSLYECRLGGWDNQTLPAVNKFD